MQPIAQDEINHVIDLELYHMKIMGKTVTPESLYKSLHEAYMDDAEYELAPVTRVSSARCLAMMELRKLHPHITPL